MGDYSLLFVESETRRRYIFDGSGAAGIGRLPQHTEEGFRLRTGASPAIKLAGRNSERQIPYSNRRSEKG